LVFPVSLVIIILLFPVSLVIIIIIIIITIITITITIIIITVIIIIIIIIFDGLLLILMLVSTYSLFEFLDLISQMFHFTENKRKKIQPLLYLKNVNVDCTQLLISTVLLYEVAYGKQNKWLITSGIQ